MRRIQGMLWCFSLSSILIITISLNGNTNAHGVYSENFKPPSFSLLHRTILINLMYTLNAVEYKMNAFNLIHLFNCLRPERMFV